MSTRRNFADKMDVHSAHHDYRQAKQEQSGEELTEDKELLIRTYALSPSMDEVLWKKLDTLNVKASSPRRISGKAHGVIDYAFAAALGIAPLVFGLKNKMFFGLLADATALSAALTKDSKGIFPVIPLKAHRAVDVALLAGLAGIATTKAVRKHKPSLFFSLGMLAAGVTTVLLTDWNTQAKKTN